jgi:hypothetical protein
MESENDFFDINIFLPIVYKYGPPKPVDVRRYNYGSYISVTPVGYFMGAI